VPDRKKIKIMYNFFSFRHQGTKTLRKNNKVNFFVSLCLGGKHFLVLSKPEAGPSALLRLAGGWACPG
jgi:hypothetical protein